MKKPELPQTRTTTWSNYHMVKLPQGQTTTWSNYHMVKLPHGQTLHYTIWAFLNRHIIDPYVGCGVISTLLIPIRVVELSPHY